jgi:formylglycine-generating enzyme required for sulfatase activity
MLGKILSALLLMLLVSGCIMQTPLQTPQPVVEEEIEASPAAATEPNSEMPTEPVAEPDVAEVPEGMVLIPATVYMMGCDPEHNNGYNCPNDELPQHKVSLSAYAIDVYEVTNAQYAACVAAGGCAVPIVSASKTRDDYYQNPEYANFPMINVKWEQAQAYCTWAGKRLPTEAEWELAARGTTPKAYPWGDEAPDCSKANVYHNATMSACVGDTVAVGSYPEGASEFGVMDMTGNVWEWVADSYIEDFYSVSPTENPLAEEANQLRTVRGGGWASNWLAARVSSRAYDLSFYSGSDLGFRCAADGGQ